MKDSGNFKNNSQKDVKLMKNKKHSNKFLKKIN